MPLRARLSVPWLITAVAMALACEDDVAQPGDPSGTGDRRPPQAIDDLTLAYDADDETAVLTWTARADDLVRDRADRYDIRYGYAFPLDWESLNRVESPPTPLGSGSVQHFELSDPFRGRDLYASIRAIDAAGNESPVGNVAHVRVPGFTFEATFIDALARAPVVGLDALVTTRAATRIATGADGRITLDELAGGTIGLLVASGAAPAPYHRFEDAFTLGGDVALVYAMVPFQLPNSPLYPSILSLLADALYSPGREHILKTWKSFPIAWYAPDFVNSRGVDYRAAAEQAATRWNQHLGFDLFTPVSTDPPVGVALVFLPRSSMGGLTAITEYDNDADGYPRHDQIRIVDDYLDGSALYLVMLHELGHTIPLGHLPAGFLMFSGQPLPPDVTDDEVDLVRLLLSLPNDTDLSKYDPAPPTP